MNSLDIADIRAWFESGIESKFIADNFCTNRSEFNGRLFSYENTIKPFLTEACLYLTTSSIGEVGNNCFDHNLGFWQGPLGCLFVRSPQFCIVADRGQGIKNSLSKVYKLEPQENSYLEVAFQKVITGRAPEKRGNGLKFTKKNILKCNLGLYCVSAEEELRIGREIPNNLSALVSPKLKNSGTLTIITWH